MLQWAAGLVFIAEVVAPEYPLILDPVVATASPTANASLERPFAIAVVDADTLAAAGPRINLSEALARVPGVSAAHRHNYAQDQQISSRGFGARAGFGMRGLRAYADGIPATAPDGQGQVAHFNLASAERIEVLRGPFSALYGNASGGVIALFSRDARADGANASTESGAFGLQQYRLGGEGRFGQAWNALGEATHLQLDGFRPHSAARRTLAFTRLAMSDGADGAVLSANHWEQPAQDPLGLTRAQFDADPRQTAPQAIQFDTRKEARQTQAGAAWRRGNFGMSTYGGTRAVTQWLAIPVAVQTNPLHSGGVVDFDRRYYGGDAHYTLRWTALDLTGGLNAEWQDEGRRGYENFIGSQLGVTGALRRDEDNRVRTFDQYLQAEWRLAEPWTGTLGLRHGEVRFDTRDRFFANGDDSGVRRFSYTNPVAGLRYRPIEGWSLYASAGRGYETPTFNELAYRPDGTTGLNTALRPQTSRQIEMGTKWRGPRGSMELALFHARAEDELVVLTNSGGRASFGNAGRTGRHGAELAGEWRFAPRWKAFTALGWLDATYRDEFLTCAGVPCTTPTLRVPRGNQLPGAPAYSSFLELAWNPSPRTQLGLECRGRSRVAVNDANSDFAAGHGLLGLRAQYEVPWSLARLRVGARLDNLLDRVHAGSVIVGDANGRYFEPGAPRSWLLSITLEPGA